MSRSSPPVEGDISEAFLSLSKLHQLLPYQPADIWQQLALRCKHMLWRGKVGPDAGILFSVFSIKLLINY